MNTKQKPILDPSSPERFDAILKHATAKARTNPDFAPITLELTDTNRADWTIAGHDVFTIDIAEGGGDGRSREVVSVSIRQGFAEFISHSDFEGLVLCIPSTEHNLSILASHVPEGIYKIYPEDALGRIVDRAKKLTSVRDAEFEGKQPSYKPEETELSRAQQRIRELEQEKKVIIKEKITSHSKAYDATHQERSNKYAEKIFNEAKAEIVEEQKVRIAELTAQAKNGKYFTTQEYKAEIYPLVVVRYNELLERKGVRGLAPKLEVEA